MAVRLAERKPVLEVGEAMSNKKRLAFLAWNTRRCESWDPTYTGRAFKGGPWTPKRSSHTVWYKTFGACVDGAIKASGWTGRGKL
jgi:hypothetical protein